MTIGFWGRTFIEVLDYNGLSLSFMIVRLAFRSSTKELSQKWPVFSHRSTIDCGITKIALTNQKSRRSYSYVSFLFLFLIYKVLLGKNGWNRRSTGNSVMRKFRNESSSSFLPQIIPILLFQTSDLSQTIQNTRFYFLEYH